MRDSFYDTPNLSPDRSAHLSPYGTLPGFSETLDTLCGSTVPGLEGAPCSRSHADRWSGVKPTAKGPGQKPENGGDTQ